MSNARLNFFGALCVGMSFLAVAYSVGDDTGYARCLKDPGITTEVRAK